MARLGAEAPPRLSQRLAGFRERLFFAEAPTIVLVLLLSLETAQSTIIMAWVNHSEVFTPVAFLGVLAMSILALARIVPAFVALPLGAARVIVGAWAFQ